MFAFFHEARIVGTRRAVAVDDAYGDVGQVVAVGLQAGALAVEAQGVWLAGRADGALGGGTAVGVIGHDTELAVLVDDILLD